MNELALIRATYEYIDARFEVDRRQAAAISDLAKVEQIEDKQRVNDQAYFILCWGQIESDVDKTCRRAIRKRQLGPRWEDRRGWDLFNPDDHRLSGLSFEERSSLVLDKSEGAGSPRAKLMEHYQLRNQIAHGKLRPDRIDIPAVVGELYIIQSALSE